MTAAAMTHPVRRPRANRVLVASLSVAPLYLMAVVVGVRRGELNDDAVQWPVIATLLSVLLAIAGAFLLAVLRGRRSGTGGLLVVVLAAVALFATHWAINTPLHRTERIAVPPLSASPQTVVTAEVAAMNAHDVTTMCALIEPGSPAWQQCQRDPGVISARLVEMRKPVIVGSDLGSQSDPDTITIGVTLDWRLRSNETDDDGISTWGFDLARVGPSRAWRIVGEGTG